MGRAARISVRRKAGSGRVCGGSIVSSLWKKFGLHVVSRDHPRRDQKFLAGLRIFGQQHGQNVVVAAAIKNRSIRETP